MPLPQRPRLKGKAKRAEGKRRTLPPLKARQYDMPKLALEDREDYPHSGRHLLPGHKGGRGLFQKPEKLSYPDQGIGSDPRIAHIPMEEPIFVLRANDMTAPALVRLWADLNALNPKCRPALIKAARLVADHMMQWPDKQWPE